MAYVMELGLGSRAVTIFGSSFFFKRKTAYEMRISDWSSDVCSSDLFVRSFVGLDKGHRTLHVEERDGARIVVDGTGKAAGVLSQTSASERSEERRVGKECVSTCRSRRALSH